MSHFLYPYFLRFHIINCLVIFQIHWFFMLVVSIWWLFYLSCFDSFQFVLGFKPEFMLRRGSLVAFLFSLRLISWSLGSLIILSNWFFCVCFSLNSSLFPPSCHSVIPFSLEAIYSLMLDSL